MLGELRPRCHFADDGGVIAGLFEQLRKQDGPGVEVAPVVGDVCADDAWDADEVRVSAGQQRCAGRRADGAVGVEFVESYAGCDELVDVLCLQIRCAVAR